MTRIRYEPADNVCKAVRIIVTSGLFPHIPPDRVYCLRSRGARTLAIARIYGLPRPWTIVLGGNPGYIIEVVSERFDRLAPERKIEVLVHELLHIPKSFSGGLRPHGRYVNDREVRRIVAALKRLGVYAKALQALGLADEADR